jgi:hypothetical protein
LSLVTRLMGFGLCLVGGFMIGWVQGIQTIVDTIDGSITAVAASIPNLDTALRNYVASQIQQNVNPLLGSYWAFGILLAFAGFVLVARGDRKPRSSEEGAPLVPQAVPEKQQ